MSKNFATKQDAFDHMDSFAVGDPVNVFQIGGLNHYGTVHRAVAFGEAEIFGGKFAKMDIKLKQGNNVMVLTDKMMVDGSWILNYVGADEVIESEDTIREA